MTLETSNLTKNVYIHIPFCKSKCHYCSFVSFNQLELKADYLDALKKQIQVEYKGESLNTLYFGGGTPSLLTIKEFEILINLFNFENNAEITVEINPDSVDLEYLQGLKSLGINRLSIGIQTFDDEILKLIGREHDSSQALLAMSHARKAKFNNISMDFIYGLPTQTLQNFESDLKKAVSLGVENISLYGLKIEDDCYFDKKMPKNILDLDMQADMYLKAVELLKTEGFEHYEISNFSRPGYNSKHNLNYWNNNTYYGFGCSASGYIKSVGLANPTYERKCRSGLLSRQQKIVRYTNEIDLEKYIQNPLKKISKQKLSQQEILEEEIFLGLRKIKGINVEEINQKFEIDFNKRYVKILNKYSDFFVKTQKGWALTLEGILISNEILSEFIVS